MMLVLQGNLAGFRLIYVVLRVAGDNATIVSPSIVLKVPFSPLLRPPSPPSLM